jgi:metallo-beta-lactamase family protein
MAEGGRIRHHIHRHVSNERNTILLVGYADPHSLAGKLIKGVSPVRIFGEDMHVAAQIQTIKSMSAHGDYEDLLRFLSCQDPEQTKRIFLVHGEYDVQQAFTDKLREKGFKHIAIPEYHQEFDLSD